MDHALLSSGVRTWLPALVLLLVSALGGAVMELRPPVSGQIEAIFPPWWSNARSFGAVAGAGGSIVRIGALPTFVVVTSADPSFHDRLRTAGAWFLVNPVALGGCLSGSDP